MRVSDIEIGGRYLIRRWVPPVKRSLGNSGQPSGIGFPGYWEHLEVQVVGRDGKHVHTERRQPRALSRDRETWKVTWGEKTVAETFDHRRIVQRVD